MLIYAILLIVMMIFNNSGVKERLMEKRAARRAAKQVSKEGSDMAMLEVTKLGISFGGLRAVDELSHDRLKRADWSV